MTLFALLLAWPALAPVPSGPLAEPQNPPAKPAPPALELPKRYLAAKPKPDAVLAKVGGVPIRAQDLEPYLWDWRAYEAIQDVLTFQMIATEAKRLKIVADPVAVERELNRQLEAAKTRLQPGQTVTQSLLEQGFPKSRLWLRIQTEQLLDKLVLQSFAPKNYVKVSTIIVRVRTGLTTDLADAIRRAEDAHTALKNGEPWGDVLSRYTDDPSTLQNQGLLGWRELSAFPAVVQQEMGLLHPGGITRPAQTSNGIQIFRVEAFGKTAEGAQLQELKEAFKNGSRQKYLDDLRKRIKTEIFFGR